MSRFEVKMKRSMPQYDLHHNAVNYRNILIEIVNRHARYKPANGNIETQAICDKSKDEYLVMDIGWNEKEHRVHDVVLHFRLHDNKVYIERDITDAEVVKELIDAGIQKDDIAIAFTSPKIQPLTEFALV